MLKALKVILEIQELDMKMIQLMYLKKKRQTELGNINANKASLNLRVSEKETEILELKKFIRLAEGELNDTLAKIKKLEAQQSSIRKVEEYNAITHEISAADRERLAKEQRLSDIYDKLTAEEELLTSLQTGLSSTVENSKVLEAEIHESISQINEEGRVLKTNAMNWLHMQIQKYLKFTKVSCAIRKIVLLFLWKIAAAAVAISC